VKSELRPFYRQLCAKEINQEMTKKLEKEIPMIFYKLEKIFPLGWSNPMRHIFIHLSYEAKVGGWQQYRWMYHIERTLKKIIKMVGNKARVEGRITDEFKLKEIAYFTSVYFIEHHNVNASIIWYHVDEYISSSDLRIFHWKGTTVGASTTYQSNQEEQIFALLYMNSNMDEMNQYFM
jgi:hypothetical protein